MRDLSALIKAYDIRGVVTEQWGPDLSREVGTALVEVLGIRSSDGGAGRIVVGHDMRPTGPDLVAAFIDGVTAAGVDVVNIGLCSTDGLYFASGRLDIPGAMFTASHNPAEYNGIKLCRAGAAPDTATNCGRSRQSSGESPRAIPGRDRVPGRFVHAVLPVPWRGRRSPPSVIWCRAP